CRRSAANRAMVADKPSPSGWLAEYAERLDVVAVTGLNAAHRAIAVEDGALLTLLWQNAGARQLDPTVVVHVRDVEAPREIGRRLGVRDSGACRAKHGDQPTNLQPRDRPLPHGRNVAKRQSMDNRGDLLAQQRRERDVELALGVAHEAVAFGGRKLL